ncbi:MAG TPA: WYL domain-containing protein [Propionicimonas sp.]|nr:WYL domain-containing protein [Propionicimonas sp.]
MTSADQVSRLLALVPYLQLHPDADLDRTSADFGITTTQLIADLRVLWYCGLPEGMPGDLIEIDMDAVAETGRIRLSNADYLRRPMRFTPDEALSLVVALRAVAELVGEDAAEAVRNALAKLETAAGTPTATTVAVSGGAPGVREQLAAAISDGRQVTFDYTDAALEPSRPTVAPVRLITSDGFGYLQAWSPQRADWRTYRLDRIAEVHLTEHAVPELGEPPEFGPSWLESSTDAVAVTLTVTPQSAWIAEYIPVQQLRRSETAVELDLLVADPAWLRALVLRLGPGLLAAEPAQLLASAVDAATEALAGYRAG